MEMRGAIAVGLATIDDRGAVLDTWYLSPKLTERPVASGSVRLTAEDVQRSLGETAVRALGRDERRGVEVVAVQTTIASLSDRPIDVHDLYLRLHLLSHRIIRPREASLDGIFQLLTNVAWTSLGPCPLDRLDDLRLRARSLREPFSVTSIEKIPRMTDYVVPSQVRIADANRIRLGAYLSPDTLVMQEGFCNFNAGTLGKVMVEGRISAGVVVGEGTDIGGGASIMGILSGGGKHVVSIGKGCLLGANSGVGISLGDGCVVEAGLYVTAGTRVTLEDGTVVKAIELAGRVGLLFRRNSETGAVQALEQRKKWGEPFTGVS